MSKSKRIKTFKKYKIEHEGKLASFHYNVKEKFFYIYRITDLKYNKHYYGSRISKKQPKYDIGVNYFSSSRDKEFKKAMHSYKERFKYKIIKIFNNNADKILYESFLHQFFDVKTNDKFFNLANAIPSGFDTTGFVTCLNLLTDKIHYVTKNEFADDINLVGIGYGMVNCIDINTNTTLRVNKKQFNDNPNLVGITYGKVACINKLTQCYIQVTKEEFYNNTNLVGVVYGKVNCLDLETNKSKQVSKEEFDSNDNLVGVIYNRVTCVDLETNKYNQVYKEEFDSNSNLVGVVYGKVNCLDLETNKSKQVSKEEFDSNDNLVSLNKNKVACKLLGTDKHIQVTKEEFDSNPNLVGTTHGSKLVFTQNHKDNMSKSAIGKIKSESHRKNLSLAITGKVYCKLLGTEEIIHVSQEEFDSNPNLVGTTHGYISCVCTLTGKLKLMSHEDLIQHNTYIQCNRHKIFTIKFPDGSIKLLNDKEFHNLREDMLLSNNALNISYKLSKPIENSNEFYNKRLNARTKNSIGFQILNIEKKLY